MFMELWILHLLCKRPEVFTIPWTFQKLNSFLKYTLDIDYKYINVVRDLFHVYLNRCEFHSLRLHIDKANYTHGHIHTSAQMCIPWIKCVLEQSWKTNSQSSQPTQLLKYFKYTTDWVFVLVEFVFKTHVRRISFPTRIFEWPIESNYRYALNWGATQLPINQSIAHVYQRTISVETHCWTANQKELSALPDPLHANQWLFYKRNQENNANITPTKRSIVSCSSLCQWHSLIFGHRLLIFYGSCLHITCHLFNHRLQFQYWDQFNVFSPTISGRSLDMCYQA